ncbi:MAG: site-specific integrase [Hyphomonadaceae bacterium]|nr:site-specific integrase [Hyphomonadaceae bacterium]MBY0564849.1 site-specific integrase [Hyphomonadaceae bacterium]
MSTQTHEIMGGKVLVYRRERSQYWQCYSRFDGRKWRVSTKTDSLSHAKDFAEDWYLELRGKAKAGILKGGKRFKDAAEKFLIEYPIITEGQRSESWIKQYETKLNAIILPYLGNKYLADIDEQTIQEYRIHRAKTCKTGKPPSRSTLHQEIVAIRQVLKTAKRNGWIQHLPDLSMPYKAAGKISRRAWFSPEEYKTLYEATRDRIENPRHNRGRWVKEAEDLHDYVLFMANTGLRPDEAANLELRDITVVGSGKNSILEIDVRGKRGVGYCKSTHNAVFPFQRTVKRKGLTNPTDKVFGKPQRELLNTILEETNLKFDRDGQRRTAYSLRHTYICLRLIEGADIYSVAKNCRTSVEMIQKFYANHIKDMIDAERLNVRKPKAKAKKPAKRKT